jgi:biopolymer transport protein ExbD
MSDSSRSRSQRFRPRFETPESQKNLSSLAQINTTPLIDVMLVLLVIFILAAPLVSRVLWSGLAQTLPNSNPKLSQKAPAQSIQIQIDASGFVWLQQQNSPDPAIKYELGQPTNSPSTQELQQKLISLHQQKPETSVVLYADQDTRYALIAKALEQARAAGFEQIAIATQTPSQNSTKASQSSSKKP